MNVTMSDYRKRLLEGASDDDRAAHKNFLRASGPVVRALESIRDTMPHVFDADELDQITELVRMLERKMVPLALIPHVQDDEFVDLNGD